MYHVCVCMLQNGTECGIRDASDGTNTFRAGIARRTETLTDYGPASNNAATIVNIDLQMVSSKFNEGI